MGCCPDLVRLSCLVILLSCLVVLLSCLVVLLWSCCPAWRSRCLALLVFVLLSFLVMVLLSCLAVLLLLSCLVSCSGGRLVPEQGFLGLLGRFIVGEDLSLKKAFSVYLGVL